MYSMCPCGQQNTEVVEHNTLLKISKLPLLKMAPLTKMHHLKVESVNDKQ